MTGTARADQARSRRDAILKAAQNLMIEHGYAAVTVRAVAERAAVKPALLQHHFPTVEALLLQVYREAAERSIAAQQAALADPRPLHALWTLSTGTRDTALAIEFMALANHRKAIRAEIAYYAERARQTQAAALERLVDRLDLKRHAASGGALSLLIAGAARALVMEGQLGITGGHDDLRSLVGTWMDVLEP